MSYSDPMIQSSSPKFYKSQFMKIPQFLLEIIRRLVAKTPWAFKLVQLLGLITAVVIKLPDFLASVGYSVPVAEEPYKTIILTAGITATIISQLAVSDCSRLKDSINRE